MYSLLKSQKQAIGTVETVLANIHGIETLLSSLHETERKAVVYSVRFPINDNGELFVTCGGDCILALDMGNNFPKYIVRDDEAGRSWDYRRREGIATGARPFPKLRIVQSA